MESSDKLEAYFELVTSAMLVAATGPARLDKYGRTSTVNRSALIKLRAALDASGHDWRGMRARLGIAPVKEGRS